jgi:hypothetical protein
MVQCGKMLAALILDGAHILCKFTSPPCDRIRQAISQAPSRRETDFDTLSSDIGHKVRRFVRWSWQRSQLDKIEAMHGLRYVGNNIPHWNSSPCSNAHIPLDIRLKQCNESMSRILHVHEIALLCTMRTRDFFPAQQTPYDRWDKPLRVLVWPVQQEDASPGGTQAILSGISMQSEPQCILGRTIETVGATWCVIAAWPLQR